MTQRMFKEVFEMGVHMDNAVRAGGYHLGPWLLRETFPLRVVFCQWLDESPINPRTLNGASQGTLKKEQ